MKNSNTSIELAKVNDVERGKMRKSKVNMSKRILKKYNDYNLELLNINMFNLFIVCNITQLLTKYQ